MHTEDEGARGENSPRIGAGRGLAYWASANGVDRRVVYVTPGSGCLRSGVWDYDLPCAPILFDMIVNGRTIKALAQPTKQAFLFVLNRENGEPIWPIEERPVPQSNVPKERTSPTQPFPTKPAPFDMQGITENDLMDLTPALKAEALEVVKRYRMGPLFTPPVLSSLEGPLATLQVPSDVGGANWPGGSMDPDDNFLYIHSHTAVFLNGLVPANPAQSDMGYVSGQARGGGAGPGRGGGPAAGPGPGRGGATVQGLPLMKPPYDRITAYNMNTGDIVWQKAHSSTPDNIKNHPALKGMNLPRTGQPGRTFIGVLTTKRWSLPVMAACIRTRPANASLSSAPTTSGRVPTSVQWRCRRDRLVRR